MIPPHPSHLHLSPYLSRPRQRQHKALETREMEIKFRWPSLLRQLTLVATHQSVQQVPDSSRRLVPSAREYQQLRAGETRLRTCSLRSCAELQLAAPPVQVCRRHARR